MLVGRCCLVAAAADAAVAAADVDSINWILLLMPMLLMLQVLNIGCWLLCCGGQSVEALTC